MTGKELLASVEAKSQYSWVYYYLVAGITVLVAVFLFLPRVSIG